MSDELKQKGKKILANGGALGDTSGRTHNLNEKSVFALASRNFEHTVIMYSREKKKVFSKLKKNHDESRVKTIMHSVKIFYALKNYVSTCPSFHICCDGFNSGGIKHYLKQFFGGSYHEQKINLRITLRSEFGKKNIADRLAYEVNKKGKKPTFILKEKHFKKLKLL